MKKKLNLKDIKLKTSKDNLEEIKNKQIDQIESDFNKIIQSYKDKNFDEVKDILEEEFKELFKRYKDWNYHGYSTRYGVDDITINFTHKDD